MKSFSNDVTAERLLNAEAVKAFLRKIGGYDAEYEVRNAIYHRRFISPDRESKMDGQHFWSFRRVVEWCVRHRPTSEAARAVERLRIVEATCVSP